MTRQFDDLEKVKKQRIYRKNQLERKKQNEERRRQIDFKFNQNE